MLYKEAIYRCSSAGQTGREPGHGKLSLGQKKRKKKGKKIAFQMSVEREGIIEKYQSEKRRAEKAETAALRPAPLCFLPALALPRPPRPAAQLLPHFPPEPTSSPRKLKFDPGKGEAVPCSGSCMKDSLKPAPAVTDLPVISLPTPPPPAPGKTPVFGTHMVARVQLFLRATESIVMKLG